MKKILIPLFAMLVVFPAYAVDGTALLKQVDRNLSPESYEPYRKLINVEPDSPLYKGFKSVMIFAKLKGRDFKDEVFTLTFMPNIESLR